MDFLTEAERQDINEHTQMKRSVALGRLSELAVTISNLEQVMDTVRALDPRTAHKLGKSAQTLLDQLEKAGVSIGTEAPVVTELAPAPAETSEEDTAVVAVQEEIAEPEPASEVIVSAPLIDTPVQPEPVAVEEAAVVTPEADRQLLSPAGEKWLVNVIGNDWRVRLAIADSDTPEEIARKLVNRVNLRSESYKGPYLERTLLRIQGLSPLETSKVQEVSTGAISQHSWQLKRRFALGVRDEDDPRDALPEVQTDTDDEDAAQPQDAAPAPAPLPRAPISSVIVSESAVAEPEKAKKLDAGDLAALLQERTGINSTGRAGLTSFLDAKSNGDMTAAKSFAVESTANYLRPLLDGGEYELAPEEMRWIRAAFGVVTMNEKPINRDPVPLKDIRRQALARSAEHANRAVEAVYTGLEKLLLGGPSARLIELRQADAVRAALEFDSISEDDYETIQNEVIAEIESEFGSHAAEQIKAALENYPNVAVTKEMRSAFSSLRQLVLVSGNGSTGWVQFDTAIRDFLSISHPGGKQPVAMTGDERKLNNRNVTAGMYIHLQNAQKEQAA